MLVFKIVKIDQFNLLKFTKMTINHENREHDTSGRFLILLITLKQIIPCTKLKDQIPYYYYLIVLCSLYQKK